MTVAFFSSNQGNYAATRSPSVVSHVSYVPLAGDVIIAWFSSTVNTSTMTTPTALGWFNPLGGNTIVASDSHALACLYRIATPAEQAAGTNPTWTATNLWDATATGDLVLSILRGGNPSNPLDVAASTFDSGNTVTPHVLAGVTPRFSNSCVASGVAKDGTGTYTAASGWQQWTSANTNCGMSMQVRDALSVGGTAIAAINTTPSAGDEYCSITVAVRNLAPVSANRGLSVAVQRNAFY